MQKKPVKLWFAAALALLLFAQACAAPQAAPTTLPTEIPAGGVAPSPELEVEETAAPTPEPTLEPSPIPTEPPAPTATTPADPLAGCPEPGADTSLHVSLENGYCLLIPAGFSIQDEKLRPRDALALLGPTETMDPKQQEGMSVMLRVEYNGPAEGMDSATYAREWHKRYATELDPFDQSQATAGGQPAVVLSNLPGFGPQRAAFVIANGARYRISLMPQPEDFPELAEPAQRGWDTLLESIVFFPPQRPIAAVRAGDACPQETAEAKLFTSELDGYCFLYPADFAPNPDLPGMVSGGPVVGTWEAGDVYPSLTVGNYFGEAGLTPRQLLEPRIEFVQQDSIADATVGGQPAVTFIDLNGAWPSRQAMVVVNGERSYTVLAQPLDPQRFPDAPPYVDRLWDTAISSIAFFDPWY